MTGGLCVGGFGWIFKSKMSDLTEDMFNYQHLQRIQPIWEESVHEINLKTLNIIDRDVLNEIKTFISKGQVDILFGKTIRDIKLVLQDEWYRKHEIIIVYKSPKKLGIVSLNLPHTALQDKEYRTLEEIIYTFKKYVHDLSQYFNQLEKIDELCTVTEPINPTFKDDFRRILLDNRIWLHVEVTSEGLATNIHLVGQSEVWQDKLQSGLLSWDHDKDIVDNIMAVFDLSHFPAAPSSKCLNSTEENEATKELPTCAICLCDQLPDDVALPLPLCQNVTCGVYFHRTCLYQWLVACSGSRPPAFGVATGSCPTCLQPITCNEKNT